MAEQEQQQDIVNAAAERMFNILTSCRSPDPQVLRAAEHELRKAEDEDMYFFTSLAMILGADDQSVPDPTIRLLAALAAKNAVPRRWRRKSKSRGNTEAEQERELLRGDVRDELLDAIGTPDSKLAIQISECVARVARMDFPDHWPNLLDDLVGRLASGNPNVVCHALTTIDMVFEQLATRRLLADRRMFNAVSDKYFIVLLQLFQAHVPLLTAEESSPSFTVVDRSLQALLRLILCGKKTIAGDESVAALFAFMNSNPAVFHVAMDSSASVVQRRLSLRAAKIVSRTHRQHPVSSAFILSYYLDLLFGQLLQYDPYTGTQESEGAAFEAASFLRGVAQCLEYRITRQLIDVVRAGSAPPPETEAEVVARMVLNFFNPERTQALVRFFLSKTFVLTTKELATWQDDPETLMQEEEAASWGDDSTRHECEELLRTLLIRDKDMVGGMLIDATAKAWQSANEHPLVLDACYRAIGKCVYDIDTLVPFESWFQQHLTSILDSPGTGMGFRVLKARAAWLIGQFVGQLSRAGRVAVYARLVPLLSMSTQDHVVALTAAKSLQHLVEDLGFFGSDFVPYLNQCLTSIFEMSRVCEAVETKRDLLGFASGIIQRCPLEAVSQLTELVASNVPVMWEQAAAAATVGGVLDEGNENLYRTALALLMLAIVRKLGPVAMGHPSLRNLGVAIVVHGTHDDSAAAPTAGNGRKKKQTGHVYMLEEACELWEAMVNACPHYEADMDALYPRVISILTADFDNLQMMYRVIEGYALLGGLPFMQAHGISTEDILAQALNGLRDRGCLATCEVIDIILQLFPHDAPKLFVDTLRRLLTRAASGDESRNVAAAYVGLVLRAAVGSATALTNDVLVNDADSIGYVVQLGLDTLDHMYLARRRKMAVLGLCAITVQHVAANSAVQGFTPRILNGIVQVFAEASENGGPGSQQRQRKGDFENYVSRFGESEETNGADEEERIAAQLGAEMPGAARRAALLENDPAAKMDLRAAAMEVVSTLKNAGLWEASVAATGKEVLGQLEGFLQAS